MRSSIFLSLFLISQFAVFSQASNKGQLITTAGDTLEVYLVKKNTNNSQLSYTEIGHARDEDEKIIFANEVKGFTSDKIYLKSFRPLGGSHNVLGEGIHYGEFNMFKTVDSLGLISFYVTKDNKDFVLIPRDSFQTFLNKEVLKHQLIKIDIQPAYSVYYLKNIFSSYDASVKPERYIYTKESYQKKLEFGLVTRLGLQFGTIKTEDQILLFDGGGTTSIGINLNVRYLPRLYINSAFIYNQLKFSLNEENINEFKDNNKYYKPRKGVIKLNSIQIPITVQYNLSKDPDLLKFEIGTFLNYLVSGIVGEDVYDYFTFGLQTAIIGNIKINRNSHINLGFTYNKLRMPGGNLKPSAIGESEKYDINIYSNSFQLTAIIPLFLNSN